MIPPIPPADVAEIDRAINLIKAGEVQDALLVLVAMKQKYPGHFFLDGILGKVFLQQQDFASSAFHFRKVIESNPNSEVASYGLFLSLWNLNERKDAMRELDRYLAANPPEIYLTALAELEFDDLPENRNFREIIRRHRERYEGLLK